MDLIRSGPPEYGLEVSLEFDPLLMDCFFFYFNGSILMATHGISTRFVFMHRENIISILHF